MSQRASSNSNSTEGTPSARTPTADVPNTAAFMGGVIAQETIKMITKQYVPQKGYCVIDLVDSKTGVVQG